MLNFPLPDLEKRARKILGVPEGASRAEIKLAYRGLAKELHPDLHPHDPLAEARFKLVSEAYEILTRKRNQGAYLLARFDGENLLSPAPDYYRWWVETFHPDLLPAKEQPGPAVPRGRSPRRLNIF